ncbi:MAG: DUF3800 domain-containing protein [Thermodesulfobacteriota bacterium]|nr:DUF3800 domain-containing protein [Thermodesulfobacteriota bacterium]
MFFHIDESGNTGNNLFDPNQPQLSYGVLSSTANVDVLGKPFHKKMLQELSVDSLHANILGVDKLTRISRLLYDLQKRIRFDFDYYFIHKPTFALTMFFDAVFDAGLNEAVKWDLYWSPLRYPIIHRLATLFDEDLLKESWDLCKHKKINTQEQRVVSLLRKILSRTQSSSFDIRSKELIIDALKYGITHPLTLDFGASDQNFISPNAICFQFVITAMAMRLRKKKRKNARAITVDRQSQFNQAQIDTHFFSLKISEGLKKAEDKQRRLYLTNPMYHGLDTDNVLYKGIPQKNIKILSSENSIGLQIVDIYLWIVNRFLSGTGLSNELKAVANCFFHRSMVDGISMEGMKHRWEKLESELPAIEDLTEEQMEYNRQMVENHRAKVAALGI